MAKTRIQKGMDSQYANVEEKVFIETEIARGKSTDEIREGLIREFPRYGLMKDLVINHMIGACRTHIVVKNLNEKKEQEASVENYEERAEEKEKKYFSKIFDNNVRIEALKEKALQYYEENPEKIRPKDYKDLSVAQAIGTRDLRDYKVRKAGRLDGYTGEQLEAVKITAIQILLKKKGGKVESKQEVVVETPDRTIIEMEENDEGVFEGEQEAR